MKWMLVLFIVIVSICACTKDNTDAFKVQVAHGVATALSSKCKNTTNIENDISRLLGVQTFETGNPLLGTVCTVAVTAVLPLALEKGIPSSWECDLTTTVDAIKDKGAEFCKGL